jgi:hypothetical protein
MNNRNIAGKEYLFLVFTFVVLCSGFFLISNITNFELSLDNSNLLTGAAIGVHEKNENIKITLPAIESNNSDEQIIIENNTSTGSNSLAIPNESIAEEISIPEGEELFEEQINGTDNETVENINESLESVLEEINETIGNQTIEEIVNETTNEIVEEVNEEEIISKNETEETINESVPETFNETVEGIEIIEESNNESNNNDNISNILLTSESQSLTIASGGNTQSSDAQNTGEWRMQGRDLQRTAYYPGATTGNISNTTSINSGSVFSLSSSKPAIVGNALYIGDNTRLFKYNAFNVSQELDRSGGISALYITGPTVWDDYVYVTSGSTYYQINNSNLSQTIATFSPGSSSWNSPIVYDGNIFFATTGSDVLYKNNASNISQVIESVAKTNCAGDFAIDGDNLYISCSATFLQLNASNISQTINQYTTSGSVNQRGGITIGGGYAYLTTSSELVYQLNATNISQLIATYSGIGNRLEAAVAYGNKGYVYTGGWDGFLYQLNSSNVSQLINKVNVGAVYYTPIVSDDYVFVTSGSGITYQLDANNISVIIASESTGGNFNSPSIANGIVYAHSGSKLYQYGDGAPLITLNSPADNYKNESQTAMINFNCSASSGTGLVNISLHLTNPSNTNLTQNQSTDITGTSNSSNWIISLSNGTYSWNCLSYDTNGLSGWGTQRTLNVGDTYAPTFTYNNPTPNDAESQSQTNIEINISIEETNLNEVKYNWNGANYTYYNDSLVLMFNFDNVSSLGENDTHVKDLGSYGNNGTLGGTAKFNTTSKFGNALWLDGDSDYIEIIDSASLDIGTDSMAITAWVYPKTFGNLDEIIKKDGSYILRLSGTSGAIEGYVWADVDTNRVGPTTNLLIQNSWNYVAMVYNGSHQQLFINGVADATDPQTGSVDNSAINLMIGSHQNKGAEFFDGGMDEVRIWNRSLSAQEVYQQYVSNLKKLDVDSWELYVNQSQNATNGLTDGNYTYSIYANDDFNQADSSTERTIIIDTVSPTFTNISNVSIEHKFALGSDINATDINGISCFTVNDTTNFQINCSGYLENNTVVNVSLYNLLITINDTAGNTNQETMWVNITPDTTLPTFDTIANQTVEYGTALGYDIEASDNNLFDCFTVNDTTNFQINCSGYLENNTYLGINQYWLNITINDSSNNLNSEVMWVNVSDTIVPAISIISPTNGTNSSNTGLNVNYTVTDLNTISCWYSNDTLSVNTTLESCVNITSVTWSEGDHNVTVWSNDTYNNKNSSSVSFTIDISAPLFTAIANQSLLSKNSLSYDVDATDVVGVSCFTVNDTTNFQIDCDGILQNNTALSVGTYWLNITVNDTFNFENSALMYVEVNTTPSIGLTLVSPTGDINATQNQTFTVSATVSCNNADCGKVNVSLDPATDRTTRTCSGVWGESCVGLDPTISDYSYDSCAAGSYYSNGFWVDEVYVDATTVAIGDTINITCDYDCYSSSSLNDIAIMYYNGTWNKIWRQDSACTDGNYSQTVVVSGEVGVQKVRCSIGYNAYPNDAVDDVCFDTTYSDNDDVNFTVISAGKSGLVSMNSSETPFWTSTQNPYNTTLNLGDSETITWTVNATGDVNTTHEFFVYANMTSDQTINNITAKWNVTIVNFSVGITAPTMTIVYPTASTFYSSNVAAINYTITNSTTLGRCWYSVDSGVTNSSTVSAGINFTDVISLEGSNNWTTYCNDTANNTASDSVIFTVDLTNPNIVINYPNSGLNSTDNSLDINYTASDANLDSCWYSNDTMGVNTTLASCANITSVTWSEGNHNVTVWVNDSVNNVVNDSVSFTIDSLSPLLTIVSPDNNTNTNDNSLDVTYTVSDNNLGNCWYNDNGGVNNSLIDCVNITSVTWSDGTHIINVYTNDSFGNNNVSSVTFVIDSSSSILSFLSPTPDNASIQTTTNVITNISIVESKPDEIKWNWNGTNYTYYNNSLILMYNLDNVSSLGENSTYVVDYSKYGNNGTGYSGILFNNSGKYQGGAYFDGSNDYIDSGDIDSIDGATELSGMAWVKLGDLNDDGTIFAKDVFNINSQLLFWRDESGTSGRTNTFAILVSTGSTDQRVEGASGSANDNNWHHVAFTYEGGSSTGLKLYVDGMEDANSGTSTTSITALESTANSFLIGKPITTSSKEFTGYIDEVRIFNRTLSAQEVYQQYVSNLNKFNSTHWYLYVNQSKNATTVLSEGTYTYYAYAKDVDGNENTSLIRTVTIDLTNPSIIINSPLNNTNTTNEGLDVLYSVSDNNLGGCWYSNDTMGVNTTLAGCVNITSVTWGVGDHNVTVWVNDSSGNENSSSITFTILSDLDNDGVTDSVDPLLYNESNVTQSGITELNITIGGNKTNETFSGEQKLLFYDQSNLMINFSHNFSSANLDLSNITIIKDSNYLIVNLSGQLQESYNKTLYLANNDFISLCVKDAEVSSINEVSSSCDGTNETDLTNCLTENVTVGYNNIMNVTTLIGCIYTGDVFAISNLRYSAIKGTSATSSGSTSTSTSGGGGGGSSGGGVIIKEEPECETTDDCSGDNICFDNQCVKLFDVKIIDVDSPIGDDGYMGFTYFLKGMANFSNDVIINFWLDKEGEEVSSGSDTIYLGSFEEKTEKTKIFVPKKLLNGSYTFYVKVSYGNYAATSHRTVYVEQSGEVREVSFDDSALVGGAYFNFKEIIRDYTVIWLSIIILLFVALIIIIFYLKWGPSNSLKYKAVNRQNGHKLRRFRRNLLLAWGIIKNLVIAGNRKIFGKLNLILTKLSEEKKKINKKYKKYKTQKKFKITKKKNKIKTRHFKKKRSSLPTKYRFVKVVKAPFKLVYDLHKKSSVKIKRIKSYAPDGNTEFRKMMKGLLRAVLTKKKNSDELVSENNNLMNDKPPLP